MSHYYVQVSAVVPASAEEVYAVLSDYHEGHPAILPKPYFEEITVLEGGKGAGTVVRVQMNVYGARRIFHLTTHEPDPGRVLVESDEAAGVVTTFTVEPVNGREQARVTISTQARSQPGLRGLLERLLNPAITRRVYKAELEQLRSYVQRQQAD